MKNIYNEAGLRIRLLRESKHYTREYLSELAEISAKFLYEIEKGQKGFSADTLYKLSEVLETNPNYILFGKTHFETNDRIFEKIDKLDNTKRYKVYKILELIFCFIEND